VTLSITTWSSRVGADPSINLRGLNGSEIWLTAMCGGPPDGGPIRSPFSSRMVIVSSPIAPSALATPSTLRTRSSSDSGIARAKFSPKSPSTSRCGRTVTSLPALAWVKSSSNELFTESVSISVPAIIATPKKTASAVEIARSLRALKLRSARAAIASRARRPA
jgi:hypothetical protein